MPPEQDAGLRARAAAWPRPNGVLYVTTGFGEVFALDPRTGGDDLAARRSTRRSAPRRRSTTAASSRCSATTPRLALDARTGEIALAGAGHRRHRAARRREPGGRRPARRRSLRLRRGARRARPQRPHGLGHRGHRRPARVRPQPDQRHHRRSGDRRRHRLRLQPERPHHPARHARPASGSGRSRRAPTARPGRSADSVFLVSDLGALVRVDAETGEIVWSDAACRDVSPTAASSAAASRSGPSPTTARSSPAAGSGWRAATGCCAAFDPVDGALLGAGPAARRGRGGARGGRRRACTSPRGTGGFWLSNSRRSG